MEFFSKNGSSVKLKDGNRIGYNIFGKKKNFPIFYFHGWPGSRFELRNIPLKKKKFSKFLILWKAWFKVLIKKNTFKKKKMFCYCY